MASNQRTQLLQRTQKWLLFLGAFAVGTFVGYRYHIYDIRPALANPSNEVYFNILPGDVQVAPNTGDKVDWLLNGQHSDNVHIHFLGDSPCDPTGDPHTCRIKNGAQGQYIYYCSDSAVAGDPNANILCRDPGIDPNSGGGSTKLELPGRNNVVYAAQAAQRPKSPEPVVPKAASQIRPTNLTVVCKNNTLQVLNPSTTPPNMDTPIVPVGGLVQWNSTLNPTINIDPNKCAGSTKGNPPYCTVKSAGDISYTVKVDKCSNATPATFRINVRNLLKGCDF